MSMNDQTMTKVTGLCKEVQRLIVAVHIEMVHEGRRAHERSPDYFDKNYLPSSASGSRTTGELRRRSMDLTRALSDMRRP